MPAHSAPKSQFNVLRPWPGLEKPLQNELTFAKAANPPGRMSPFRSPP